jgi:hypothetical protein
MKQRAFVVTIAEEDDLIDDLEVAGDIQDILNDEGFTVLSVNPFGGDTPSISPTGPQHGDAMLTGLQTLL